MTVIKALSIHMYLENVAVKAASAIQVQAATELKLELNKSICLALQYCSMNPLIPVVHQAPLLIEAPL